MGTLGFTHHVFRIIEFLLQVLCYCCNYCHLIIRIMGVGVWAGRSSHCHQGRCPPVALRSQVGMVQVSHAQQPLRPWWGTQNQRPNHAQIPSSPTPSFYRWVNWGPMVRCHYDTVVGSCTKVRIWALWVLVQKQPCCSLSLQRIETIWTHFLKFSSS